MERCKYKKLRIACDFYSAKYEFTHGRILNVDKVNVIFIEPHKFLIELNGKNYVKIELYLCGVYHKKNW